MEPLSTEKPVTAMVTALITSDDEAEDLSDDEVLSEYSGPELPLLTDRAQDEVPEELIRDFPTFETLEDLVEFAMCLAHLSSFAEMLCRIAHLAGFSVEVQEFDSELTQMRRPEDRTVETVMISTNDATRNRGNLGNVVIKLSRKYVIFPPGTLAECRRQVALEEGADLESGNFEVDGPEPAAEEDECDDDCAIDLESTEHCIEVVDFSIYSDGPSGRTINVSTDILGGSFDYSRSLVGEMQELPLLSQVLILRRLLMRAMYDYAVRAGVGGDVLIDIIEEVAEEIGLRTRE